MDASQLDRSIAEANAWWRDPEWELRDVQLRRASSAPFDYRPKALNELTPGGLYLLRGPRRVGKSTEIKRTVSEFINAGTPARRLVYLSVEGWRADDLEQAISRIPAFLADAEGQRYWFLDEITSVDGPWPSVIKRMRDTNVDFAEDTIVLTGSSASGLDDATKALAGRRGRAVDADRLLLQMPFSDVAQALGMGAPESPRIRIDNITSADLHETIETLRPWLPAIIDAWDVYLTIGGYPQAVADYCAQGSVDPSLMNTLFDVVHGDALASSELSPSQTIAALRAISRSISSTLDLSSLADDADISRTTARALLDKLRRSFLAYPVHREQGMAPKPKAQAKWYCTDPLLASVASARGAGTAPDSSKVSEQQVALSLLRSLESSCPTAALRHDRLLYYRSATRAEIDFVPAKFGGLCIESKFVNRSWGRAFQTIESSPFSRGIVATRSGLARHDGGWAIPAGLLAVLLGT